MKYLVIIEDEPDLREILLELLPDLGVSPDRIKVFASWSDAASTLSADTVIWADSGGVGERPKDLNAKVYNMSGNINADTEIAKPFNQDKMIQILKSEGFVE